MSMIFQSYALWPHMTVAENIVYGLKLRKMDRDTIAKKLDAILATTRLAPLAERYPGELSGGQQQRVALARALIVEPETLLLDEPLSNLDANLREEMRFEVRRLHDAYRYTTVYVTHDQSEAMTTADLICVMNDGKIEQAGSPGGHLRPAAFGIRRALHRLQQRGQGQGAGRRPHRLCRRRAALRRRASSKPAPTPRSRSARTTSGFPPRSRQQTENVVPATVTRQVFLGGSRDYMVELKDGTQLRVVTAAGREHRAGQRGLAAPAAGKMPGAAGIASKNSRGRNNKIKFREDTPMKGSKFSRRDVLIGSGALAAGASFSTRVLSAAPPAERRHAGADRGGQEGRQGGLVHLGRPASCPNRSARRSRPSIPGVAVQGRAHRRRAPVPTHRPGICQPTSTPSTWSIRRTPRISSYWKREGMLAPYVPEDVAKFYPAEHKDRGRHVRQLPHLPLHHRLQHQSGEKGRGAEELRRSARSEMEGQDRQGASRLQRHHHDRDLPDARAISAGAISRSSPSRTSCRCSRPPIRRRRSRSASARCRPTATNT